MKFQDYVILEAPNIDPLHARYFERVGQEAKYKKHHANIFGADDRIYIPLKGKFFKPSIDSHLKEVIDFVIHKKEKQLSIKHKVLFKLNPNKSNIKSGVVTISPEKPTKKTSGFIYFIDDLFKDMIEDKDEAKVYREMFKHGAWRQGTPDSLAIVISRNPKDIGGASTCVGWKSCMNLHTGKYNQYLVKDVQEGTLVCYFIDAKDKNIEYPIGRVFIKGYLPEKRGAKHFKITPQSYGEFPDFAREALQKWLDKVQQSKPGRYLFNPELYQDYEEDEIVVGGSEGLKIGDKVKVKVDSKSGKLTLQNIKIGKIIKIIPASHTANKTEYLYKIKFDSNNNGWFNKNDLII